MFSSAKNSAYSCSDRREGRMYSIVTTLFLFPVAVLAVVVEELIEFPLIRTPLIIILYYYLLPHCHIRHFPLPFLGCAYICPCHTITVTITVTLLFELCTSPKGDYFAANLFFLFLLSFHRTYPDKAHIYLSSSSFYVLFSLPVSLSKLLRCKI